MTVPGFGRMPSPKRVSSATRAPDSSSSALTLWPTQLGENASSASTTWPLGSRHSLSIPDGSSRRITWSAVHRTVPTVGMPSFV
jgi:hypothetical protein